ncbi:MAG TPA: acetolactate synthase, large subunit, biosynthetic type, partial [Candidatus Intestinimonas stercorigallinarum]|nr:acetolactate synthase, large subunit, biosynthetic type [Candidatus Intestinimonas stercorigallinarum]
MINGAQALMESLKREGVERVFGYAGATICPAVDALAAASIAYTLVRTEQNAGHMASGYARMTGRPGVCMVTSG